MHLKKSTRIKFRSGWAQLFKIDPTRPIQPDPTHVKRSIKLCDVLISSSLESHSLCYSSLAFSFFPFQFQPPSSVFLLLGQLISTLFVFYPTFRRHSFSSPPLASDALPFSSLTRSYLLVFSSLDDNGNPSLLDSLPPAVIPLSLTRRPHSLFGSRSLPLLHHRPSSDPGILSFNFVLILF